ncbi:MAG: hypothetical protein QNJ31_02095 [Candidatus Caenarcaniphilales bacterium]|nr:hypothetical protein [Candidatus Caenarcaniphilales bacterium]
MSNLTVGGFPTSTKMVVQSGGADTVQSSPSNVEVHPGLIDAKRRMNSSSQTMNSSTRVKRSASHKVEKFNDNHVKAAKALKELIGGGFYEKIGANKDNHEWTPNDAFHSTDNYNEVKAYINDLSADAKEVHLIKNILTSLSPSDGKEISKEDLEARIQDLITHNKEHGTYLIDNVAENKETTETVDKLLSALKGLTGEEEEAILQAYGLELDPGEEGKQGSESLQASLPLKIFGYGASTLGFILGLYALFSQNNSINQVNTQLNKLAAGLGQAVEGEHMIDEKIVLFAKQLNKLLEDKTSDAVGGVQENVDKLGNNVNSLKQMVRNLLVGSTQYTYNSAANVRTSKSKSFNSAKLTMNAQQDVSQTGVNSKNATTPGSLDKVIATNANQKQQIEQQGQQIDSMAKNMPHFQKQQPVSTPSSGGGMRGTNISSEPSVDHRYNPGRNIWQVPSQPGTLAGGSTIFRLGSPEKIKKSSTNT